MTSEEQTTSIKNIKFSNENENSAKNFNSITIGDTLILYFSYNTLIAFNTKHEQVIRKNEWGPTTGKHINWINTDKKVRVSYEEFNKKLSKYSITLNKK